MSEYVTRVILFALGIVAVGGGGWLIVVAIKDWVAALTPADKDWKKFLFGLFAGLIGGVLIGWGASAIYNFFKSHGSEIPHS
ncbi:hypothetical protein ABVC38_00175 [Lactobacillus iners]|uniref:hypothetical protein n=1 Tax=Lactobacillus iners TaxID=147802 RepID=UPI0001E5DBB3|nr:hypothetical protein HMPREF9212_0227 [Lactobacillus iners LactinV 03V1-b]MCT7739184.1 hypothetical protein [Lactobacillus iners]